MNGNIVVEEVLASCYAVVDHGISQIAMKPIQWYPGVMDIIFGVENGVSAYIDVAKNIDTWFLPEGSIIN